MILKRQMSCRVPAALGLPSQSPAVTALPSQSPMVTALPEGEPRRESQEGRVIMRKANVFLYIGSLLLIGSVIFIIYALNHPEMSFPFENRVTYGIYIVYIIFTIVMFSLYIYMKKKK